MYVHFSSLLQHSSSRQHHLVAGCPVCVRGVVFVRAADGYRGSAQRGQEYAVQRAHKAQHPSRELPLLYHRTQPGVCVAQRLAVVRTRRPVCRGAGVIAQVCKLLVVPVGCVNHPAHQQLAERLGFSVWMATARFQQWGDYGQPYALVQPDWARLAALLLQ